MTLLFELIVVAIIVALSVRRALLILAALTSPRPLPQQSVLPGVALLIPARNESWAAPRLLEALERLIYPRDRLEIVFVCDGCSDASPALFRRWAEGRDNVKVVELPERAGKAAALNAGLAASTAEVVTVLDADLAPEARFLEFLVQPFADPAVDGAAAYVRPVNADEGLISRYAAVTSWVHQLITSSGLDRLGLSAPTLGASAYRRSALARCGGFPQVRLGEDISTSTRLILGGGKTRFVKGAVADNAVASDFRSYWRQHMRWARATFEGNEPAQPGVGVPVLQRLELAASSLGYGDRVVFALAALGALYHLIPLWPLLLYLAAPCVEILAAVVKGGAGRHLPRYLLAAFAFFPVDLICSVAAVAAHVAGTPSRWENLRWFPSDPKTGP